MASKKLKYGSNSLVAIVIVVGILVLSNYLSNVFFFRIDLTEGREFTVSQSTKEVLRNLDDLISIKVYFSEKLPARLLSLERQVKDMLDDFESLADGKLSIEFIDPASDPSIEASMRILGIPQIQLNISRRDKLEVINSFLGIGIFFADKKEVIPFVQNTSNLEYDLTSAIIKVTSDQIKTLGLFTGSGREDVADDYRFIQQLLTETYRVFKIDFSRGGSVPDGVETLIIIKPRNLKEREKYEIDQFLMRGGKIVFLIDRVDLYQGVIEPIRVNSNLEDMLESYGVKLKQDLVVDEIHSNATFGNERVSFSLPYPLWPRVTDENFDRDNPAVSMLKSLVLPWASSLEIVDVGEDVQAVQLATTSPAAWTQVGAYDLNPNQEFVNPSGAGKVLPLAVALTGEFNSFYAGKEIPPLEEEGSESQQGAAATSAQEERETIERSPLSQIVVVGDADFASDNFLKQFVSNGYFFQNIIDWLTVGDSLIGIRSRAVSERPLLRLSDAAKAYIRIANIAAVPVLVVLFGLVRYYLKRRSKKQFQPTKVLSNEN